MCDFFSEVSCFHATNYYLKLKKSGPMNESWDSLTLLTTDLVSHSIWNWNQLENTCLFLYSYDLSLLRKS